MQKEDIRNGWSLFDEVWGESKAGDDLPVGDWNHLKAVDSHV